MCLAVLVGQVVLEGLAVVQAALPWAEKVVPSLVEAADPCLEEGASPY